MEIRTGGPVDWLTIAAIAAIVYVGSVVLHELGGHGDACLAVGGHVKTLGAYYVECDRGNLPFWKTQIVAAAGSTMNALLALLGWRMLYRQRATGSSAVFWWLVFSVNFFEWAGYFGFSGVTALGDWGTSPDGVLGHTANPSLWRALLIVGGVALYVIGTRVSGRLLDDIVGGAPDRRRTASRVAWTAYGTGGVVAIIVGLFNPVGLVVVLTSSAASSLGGTAGLLFIGRYVRPVGDSNQPLMVQRSWTWVGCSAAATSCFAIFLGPSIHFR